MEVITIAKYLKIKLWVKVVNIMLAIYQVHRKRFSVMIKISPRLTAE